MSFRSLYNGGTRYLVLGNTFACCMYDVRQCTVPGTWSSGTWYLVPGYQVQGTWYWYIVLVLIYTVNGVEGTWFIRTAGTHLEPGSWYQYWYLVHETIYGLRKTGSKYRYLVPGTGTGSPLSTCSFYSSILPYIQYTGITFTGTHVKHSPPFPSSHPSNMRMDDCFVI